MKRPAISNLTAGGDGGDERRLIMLYLCGNHMRARRHVVIHQIATDFASFAISAVCQTILLVASVLTTEEGSPLW
jgi:hypothetical protein